MASLHAGDMPLSEPMIASLRTQVKGILPKGPYPRVSCQKGPTRHAYAWQIGPMWQDALDIYVSAVVAYAVEPIGARPSECTLRTELVSRICVWLMLKSKCSDSIILLSTKVIFCIEKSYVFIRIAIQNEAYSLFLCLLKKENTRAILEKRNHW